MLVVTGCLLILIGLISLVFSLVYAYKKFKKDNSSAKRDFFDLFINLLDIFSALDGPKSLVSFVTAISLGAIIIGIILIIGVFH